MTPTPSEIRYRRQLIARRRRKLPPAPEPLDGIFLVDPDRGVETFMPFDLIHEVCRDMMDPRNAPIVAKDLGKVDWKDDPTYDMRRKSK